MKLRDSLFSVEDRRDSDGVFEFDIRLNAGHYIYRAHFPGEPITPGVCILQIAKELLETALGCGLDLSCVRNIKFLRIIKPDETPSLTFVVNPSESDDGSVKAQVTAVHDGGTYAKLSLVCKKSK